MRRGELIRTGLALFLLLAAGWTTLLPPVASQQGRIAAGGGGDFGYCPNPEAARRFLETLEQPYFAEAGADCVKRAQGRDTYLFRPMYRAHQARYGTPFVVGKQLNGSCVAWGMMHAIYYAESVEWDIGNRDEPPLMPSSEAIYGAARVESQQHPCDGRRAYGGWQDGSWGSAAAEAVSKWGVLYRKKYPFADLTVYDGEVEKNWGAYGQGGQGDDCVADEEAKKTPVQYVGLVKSFDEAAAAIESGFPCTVASDQGFEMRRQEDGSARPSGRWMHQMCWVAVRYAKNGESRVDQLLTQNSWGPTAHSGPLKPADQPEGSFWVDRTTCERMIAQQDTWAVGKVKFVWRDIDHHTFLTLPPKD
jgi:hypothetical protein